MTTQRFPCTRSITGNKRSFMGVTFLTAPFRQRDAQILANLLRHPPLNFTVTRDGRSAVRRRVVNDGVFAPFTNDEATMLP
jgi:hypothetical protein